MRINGFEQIKAFYSWTFGNQDKNIKPHHISLYLFLVNQNNRNNWVEWFKCPFDLAMAGSCIGNKKTYYNVLLDLQDWGLIEYKKGVNNWKAPLIKLQVLKCTSSVPQSEPQPVPQHTPLPIPLPTHIYKLITSNLKLIEENLKDWIDDYNKLNTKQGKHLFKNSPYYDKNHYLEQISKTEFNRSDIDFGAYWYSMEDYSEQNGKMYKNWLATARTWIRRDIKDGNVKTKSGNTQQSRDQKQYEYIMNQINKHK